MHRPTIVPMHGVSNAAANPAFLPPPAPPPDVVSVPAAEFDEMQRKLQTAHVLLAALVRRVGRERIPESELAQVQKELQTSTLSVQPDGRGNVLVTWSANSVASR